MRECPTSGYRAGETKQGRGAGRVGWCSVCRRWRAVTSTGKFKRHVQTIHPPKHGGSMNPELAKRVADLADTLRTCEAREPLAYALGDLVLAIDAADDSRPTSTTEPTEPTARELLEEAGEVLAELHSLLPDDGKAQGTAPSWWQAGTRSNGIRAAIANYLRDHDPSAEVIGRPTGEWEVTYRVPVLVNVDLDTREVLSVRVDDTAAVYDPEASSHVSHRADLAAWEAAALAGEAAAVAIADEAEWPSWDLGL